MRVLIADGSVPFAETLQSYLWDRGHEAELAVDGLECTEVLRYFVPDVVVLEHELLWGGSDGVMAFMQGDEELADVPVILIGNKPRPHQRHDSNRPPVVAWLQKPFGLGELMCQIDRTGQRRQLPSVEAGT